MANYQKQVRISLLLLTAITTILIALGSYVRTTGAGLSCPDWPLCYGQLVPDFSILGVKQEVFHRYIAKVVGILCIVFVAMAYSKKFEYPKTLRYSIFLLGLVMIQGVFGGLTVTLKLNPLIVAIHLALGTLFWQLCFVGALDRKKPKSVDVVSKDQTLNENSSTNANPNSKLHILAGFVAWLTYFQIILGGYVGASGSSLACMDFPLCNGTLMPELFTQSIQMLHRALFVVLALAIVAVIVWAQGEGRKLGHLFGVVFMISLQLIIGVGNIHMRISPWMSIAHLLIAEMILLSLVVFWKGLKPNCRVLDT